MSDLMLVVIATIAVMGVITHLVHLVRMEEDKVAELTRAPKATFLRDRNPINNALILRPLNAEARKLIPKGRKGMPIAVLHDLHKRGAVRAELI